MLTAWGKKLVACAKSAGGSYITYFIPYTNVLNNGVAYIEAKTAGGATVYIPPMYYTGPGWIPITSALVASGSTSSYGIAFGSSDTAATENDYTMGSQVTGITANTPSVQTVFDDVNHRYIARLDYTVSNNTGSDITIKEIGLFVRFASTTTRGNSASTTAANRVSIMIDRTVLDSPVTIANGTAAAVRYDFAFEG